MILFIHFPSLREPYEPFFFGSGSGSGAGASSSSSESSSIIGCSLELLEDFSTSSSESSSSES